MRVPDSDNAGRSERGAGFRKTRVVRIQRKWGFRNSARTGWSGLRKKRGASGLEQNAVIQFYRKWGVLDSGKNGVLWM